MTWGLAAARRVMYGAESYAGHGTVAEAAHNWEDPQPGGKVRVMQIMTPNPVSGTPDRTAREVAILMRDNDCGSIPVVENTSTTD